MESWRFEKVAGHFKPEEKSATNEGKLLSARV
jgi:hypothetical protein